jgi:hypothetical protein
MVRYVTDGMPAGTDFRWLIEAPGPRYLAVQRLSLSDNFEWTTDHNRALAFRTQEQADALMMAVRQMDREMRGFGKEHLFSFETTLGNAKAVEHVSTGHLKEDDGNGYRILGQVLPSER